MSQQLINVGSIPGDGTGDKGQVPFNKVNQNFTELYNSVNNLLSSPTIRGAVRSTTLSIASNSTLTADPQLSVTLPVGIYALAGFLCFNEFTASTGGFNFDFRGGTAVPTIDCAFSASGFATAAFFASGILIASGNVSVPTISTTVGISSLSLNGVVNITTAGTFIPRFAQVSPSVNATLVFNSYIALTKLV